MRELNKTEIKCVAGGYATLDENNNVIPNDNSQDYMSCPLNFFISAINNIFGLKIPLMTIQYASATISVNE